MSAIGKMLELFPESSGTGTNLLDWIIVEKSVKFKFEQSSSCRVTIDLKLYQRYLNRTS